MRLAIALIAVAAAACVPPSVAPPFGGAAGGGARDTECLLATGDAPPSTSRPTRVTIGLLEPADPSHAPVPQSDGERVVFAHLYEPLVRVNCDGRVVPALAASWERHDAGRRWTFRLREDAQFWDGAPVTAQDVVFGKSGSGFTWSATESRAVTVLLGRETDDVPAFLADPALAVSKPAPDGGWPIGTGRYWVTSANTTEREIVAPGPSGDSLVFRIGAGGAGDARDLLDAGVDLLLTRDRALRDYAATQSRFVTVALPWDRAYVFVTPEPGGTRFDGLEDAVRGFARRAEAPFWWLNLRPCRLSSGESPPPPAANAPRRIVYPRTDPAARELAGRIAALTRGVATARSATDFASGLAAGRDWGYIVALPRVVADPCRAGRDLLPTWDATITALVDTRAEAIIRNGGARWSVDRAGVVTIPSP
ncbi:MAG: ABC transporter substrate-binding protein [Gemmatimonadales bacterium]|nr:ABC transporter substrate-binding protein [Gemmatimonadales bacterium]